MSWKALALRACVPVGSRFPRPCHWVARRVAWLVWKVRPSARNRVTRNLLPLFDGDHERATRASLAVFRSVGAYYVDLVSLPGLDLDAFDRERIVVENPEYLPVVLREAPTIIVSAHMGNPELAIQVLTRRGRGFAALVEELQPRDFAARMLELRRSGGGVFFEANLSGMKKLLGHIGNGGLAGLVGDRDIAGNGTPVTLCGQRMRVSSVPWEVARRTGATIIPAFSIRLRRGKMLVTLGEPYKVDQTGGRKDAIAEAAQRWAGEFEKQLRRAPAQWYVMEDYWRVHSVTGKQGPPGDEGVRS